MRFGYWFKIGVIVSIASMLVATLMLGVQTHWFTAPLLLPPQGEVSWDASPARTPSATRAAPR